MKTKLTQKNTAFPIFPESSWSFCVRTYQSHFRTQCACAKDRNMQMNAPLFFLIFMNLTCRFALRSAWHMRSEVSRREHYFRKAASRVHLQNEGAICKNVLHSRESMAESIDLAHAKPSSAMRRHFQTFKKACHEKWPFVTIDEKGDSCMNSEVHRTIVKWLDWQTMEHDQQKQRSQLRRISKVD